jgi:molybdopterin adenylyltransferase
VLTVSDGVSAGVRDDASGAALEELLRDEGFDVARRVVADEPDVISAALSELADEALLILTTGGTGFAPRDVTPEATRDVIDREAPGIAEAIRADALARTPHALLSRGVAGLTGRLPGLLRRAPACPPAWARARLRRRRNPPSSDVTP